LHKGKDTSPKIFNRKKKKKGLGDGNDEKEVYCHFFNFWFGGRRGGEKEKRNKRKRAQIILCMHRRGKRLGGKPVGEKFCSRLDERKGQR